MAKGIKLVTMQQGCGYGDAGYAYLQGLLSLGIPVMWIQMEKGDSWGVTLGMSPGKPQIFDHGLDLQEKDFDLLLLDLPPFARASVYQRWLMEEPDLYPIVYTTWELSRLPEWWTRALSAFELVLVPSEFNRQLFVDSGVRVPIKVVPHLAREATPVTGGQFGSVDEDDYVFYTIGTWTARKAMEQTLRVYLENFSADEPVALIIKTGLWDQLSLRQLEKGEVVNPSKHFARTWRTIAGIIAEYPNPAKIHVIAKDVSQQTIDQLHTRGDCFVSLTYAEGWGLGAFDAALFSNPSIITGWGGQLDFLGEDYPLLVDYDLEPSTLAPRDRYMEVADDRYWANADPRHAGELMRWVFEHQDEAREFGAKLGQETPIKYAPKKICGELAKLLGFAPTGKN